VRRWLLLVLLAIAACTRIVVLSPPTGDAGNDGPGVLPDANVADGGNGTIDAAAGLD